MEIKEKYELWIKNAKSKDILTELTAIKEDDKEIQDRFYRDLEFGTGGLRGKLGAGTSRLNVFTVSKVTFGLKDYLKKHTEYPQKAVIAYDSRNFSKEFAERVAGILSGADITVKLFSEPTPTPICSYAVRKFNCGIGIVITASHNPKEYNGYKVYNDKGCQITDETAKEITSYISAHDYFENYKENKGNIEILTSDFFDEFIDEVMQYSYFKGKEYNPKIVYTPLNGTGATPIKKLFNKMGIKDYVIVPEQEKPDGNFTTCPYPNPEEKSALTLAVNLAKTENADIVIATDPDADRVGIAVKNGNGYRLLSGNETGVLLENYILSKLKSQGRLAKNGYVVKTIVTTPLAEKIAKSFNIGVKNVLTGFKYIGETIDNTKDGQYVFGLEESFGYLVGTHVRDKDAVSAVMTIIDAYRYYLSEGQSFIDALEEIYKKYGYYSTALTYKVFDGMDGTNKIKNLMRSLRENPIKQIAGKNVENISDYLNGINGLPKSNVLVYNGEDFVLVVRPSGTEPKIKIYAMSSGKTEKESKELLTELLAEADKIIND